MGWTVYYRGEADAPLDDHERALLATHTATWTDRLNEGCESYRWREEEGGRVLRGFTKVQFSEDDGADYETVVRATRELQRLLPRFRFLVSDDYANPTAVPPQQVELSDDPPRRPSHGPEKVFEVGLERSAAMMYYVKDGDLWAVPRLRPGQPKGRPERIVTTGLAVDPAYLYYLDGDGDISRKPR